MSLIENEYQARVSAISIAERIAQSVSMLKWTRDMLASRVVEELGPMSDERLRWEVALRMYGAEPAVREMIERKLQDVSD